MKKVFQGIRDDVAEDVKEWIRDKNNEYNRIEVIVEIIDNDED